jgi:hypothetical protein
MEWCPQRTREKIARKIVSWGVGGPKHSTICDVFTVYMIVSFSVENYRSFSSEATLSLVASSRLAGEHGHHAIVILVHLRRCFGRR